MEPISQQIRRKLLTPLSLTHAKPDPLGPPTKKALSSFYQFLTTTDKWPKPTLPAWRANHLASWPLVCHRDSDACLKYNIETTLHRSPDDKNLNYHWRALVIDFSDVAKGESTEDDDRGRNSKDTERTVLNITDCFSRGVYEMQPTYTGFIHHDCREN